MKRNMIVTTALASLISLPAFAQSGETSADQQTGASAESESASRSDAPVIALDDWNYDELYQHGWSLTELMDAELIGEDGEEIGDVENVLIGTDGQVLSIIGEVGGFVDIGDTHVAIPFEEVVLGMDLDSITVPVDQETVEDYSVFGEWGYFDASEAGVQQVVNDDLLTGPRVWKATELLDDYAILTGGVGYGYVDDLIFVEGGRLHAVIVDPAPAYGPGPYAYPFYGYAYGWHPGAPTYGLGYGEQEVAVIDTFDPNQMSSQDQQTGSVESGDQAAGEADAAADEDETDATLDEGGSTEQ